MRAMPRRTFLRGAGGVCVGLPFLSAMESRGGGAADPKRFVVFFTNNGTVASAWTPTGTEHDFTLGPILAPLAPYQDELLVLSPHWMAIPKLVGFAAGARMRTLPAYLELQSGAWSPGQFEAAVRGALTPATRGVYLNTPNNPTGVVVSREHLEALARVAIERDLFVVSDEAYEHLLYDGAEHVSIASLPGMAERTVSVFTFSKSYAMTGWRIGYVVSPPALRGVMGPLLAFYTTHGVFPAAQLAAREAVTASQACVAQMREAYLARRGLLLTGLAGVPGVRVPSPRGAFYAFADVSGARAGRDIWALVEEWLARGVAVLPGTAFGPEYADWVRMSLATRPEDVRDAAERIAGRG